MLARKLRGVSRLAALVVVVVAVAATVIRQRGGVEVGRFLYLECGSPINPSSSCDVTGSGRPGNRDAGSTTFMMLYAQRARAHAQLRACDRVGRNVWRLPTHDPRLLTVTRYIYISIAIHTYIACRMYMQ